MTPTVTFFPVGNGDMTLIQMETGRTILIDINIRQSDEDGEIRDVLVDLRARLLKDKLGRHYVDAMLLTHPDQDHCRGLVDHFHLGPLADYVEPDEGEDGKIVIREMWSSPMVFRRRPDGDPLCADADAWAKEARRRVKLHKAGGGTVLTGNRIQVMGEDLPEKMVGIEDIVVKAGTDITTIDGYHDESFSGFLLAPKGKGNAADEERRSNNHSSVIVRFSLARDDRLDATALPGGRRRLGRHLGAHLGRLPVAKGRAGVSPPWRAASLFMAFAFLGELGRHRRDGFGLKGRAQGARPGAGRRLHRVEQQAGGGRR